MIKRVLYKIINIQTFPTINDRECISKLNSRVRGENEVEKISNVLEWQDRNIDYWYERADLSTVTAFWFALLAVDVIIGALLFAVAILCTVIHITIFSFIYPTIILLFCIGVVFIGIIANNLVYAGVKSSHFIHKKTGKKSFKKALNLVRLTFGLRGLPLACILKYKIAMCSDYTKLTVAALFNLNFEPYVISINRHSATAVEIDEKYYVLDQQLPVKKLDKWLERNEIKENRYDAYKVKENINSGNIELEYIELESDKISSSKNIIHHCDVEKITADLRSTLKLTQKNDGKYTIIDQITLEDASFFYDEVTHFSIVRLIKNKIDAEFCNNANKISNIEITENGNDLIVTIYKNVP